MSEDIVFYDGHEVSSLPKEIVLSRAMFYGENFFTSLKWNGEDFEFLQKHLSRLEKSLSFLYQENFEAYEKRIEKDLAELTQNSSGSSFYFRITFFKPMNSAPNYFIVRKDLTKSINKNIDSMCFSPLKRGESYIPSFLKLGNYTDTFLQLSDALLKGHSEVLFLNSEEQILEASTSNIFFIRGKEVFTPSLQNGILGGVYREALIEYFNDLGTPVNQAELTKNFIKSCNEIWLTNSIQGLRYVESFDEMKLVNTSFKDHEKPFRDYVRKNGKTGL